MAFLDYKTNIGGWFAADNFTVVPDLGHAADCPWLDMSGNDVSGVTRDLSVNSAAISLLGPNVPNGRPYVDFSGGGKIQGLVNVFPNYLLTNAGTIVAVVYVNSIATDNASFDNGAIVSTVTGTSTGFQIAVRGSSSAPSLEMRGWDGGAMRTVSVPFTLGQWGLVIARYDGLVGYLAWNDETAFTTGVWRPVVGNGPVGIGINVLNARSIDARVAEIALFREVTSSSGSLARVCNYLRAKWLSPNNVIGSPSMRGDALEQTRNVATRKLWAMRRPIPALTGDVPLWMGLDLDTLSDLSVTMPTGPYPGAVGWKNSKGDRRHFRLYNNTVDMDRLGSAQITAGDLRDVGHVFQETALAIRASSLQRQGIANDGAIRAFHRGMVAYIVDPSSGAVVKIDSDAEKVAAGGMLLEDGARNNLLRSSYVSGLTGILTSGTAAAGTIALDTAPPAGFLFDTSITPNSLAFSFTASGTSGISTKLMAIHPTVVPVLDSYSMVLSIDHVEENVSGSSGLGWSLARVSDGFVWDAATNAWSSAKVTLNQIPVSTGQITRYTSVVALPTTSAATFTAGTSYLLQYGFPAQITGDHLAHTYHVELVGAVIPTSSAGFPQGLEPYFPTSRIVTDATVVDRLADELHYYPIPGGSVFAPNVGTFRFKFTPLWSSSDIRYDNQQTPISTQGFGLGKTVCLFWSGSHSASSISWSMGPAMWLQYAASSGSLQFAAYPDPTYGLAAPYVAYTSWVPVAGTVYDITVRWTSTEGELGLAPNTLSVFVNGVKGVDAVAASSFSFVGMEWPSYWSNGPFVQTVAMTGFLKTPCGNITAIEMSPYARTDAEILEGW